MDKITFCIPSKNNLRYLKTCIPSIRKNAFRPDHDIIVFVDSDNDGTVEWLRENKDKYEITYFVNPKLGKELYGIGKAYDYCIDKSTTAAFMIFHADMILGKNADLQAWNQLQKKTVVCSTRIEPPLHPNAGEKILMDFGVWPEEFKEEAFNTFVARENNSSEVTEGIFAPWMMYKEDFSTLGGHDPILKSAREDSDIFNRMLLAGFSFIQPWSSLVYHFTGRGGQFQHGSVGEKKDEEWQQLMNNSTREFIRKWGSNVNHTSLMKPIVSPKYNIAYAVKSCNLKLLDTLEPWCDRIYIDDEMGVLFASYYEYEHKRTSYDLHKRVFTLGYQNPFDYDDIVVEIDGKAFTNQDYQALQILPEIMKEQGHNGKFKLGNLTVTILRLVESQNSLIQVS
jgi:glycosyltransferase involved in cell wall biosynthesis